MGDLGWSATGPSQTRLYLCVPVERHRHGEVSPLPSDLLPPPDQALTKAGADAMERSAGFFVFVFFLASMPFLPSKASFFFSPLINHLLSAQGKVF